MADSTWLSSPGTSDYNADDNWTAGVPGAGDTAFFGPSNTVAITVASTTVGGWTFNNDAANYSFTLAFGHTFSFMDAGIVVNGGSVEILNVADLDFHNASSAGDAEIVNVASMSFNDDSTAGSAEINNAGGTLQFHDGSTAGSAGIANAGGTLQFRDDSTAGNADINNTGFLEFYEDSSADEAEITNSNTISFNGDSTAGSAEINTHTILHFLNNSTAGNADIILHTGDVDFYDGSSAGNAEIIITNGHMHFYDDSTAGSAGITNNRDIAFRGDSTAGSAVIANNSTLEFFDDSTADDATITTNGGALTIFRDNSTGGNARFIAEAGGEVEFGGAGPDGDFRLSAGSIEGNGTYTLFGVELTVGSNNLSTEVGGVIAGGAVVKVGTGTLTLSGTNTYTGTTTVNGGTLQIGNGGTTGSVLGNIVTNSILAFNRSDDFTLANQISGTGQLHKNGTGTMILAGTYSHGGGTAINGGTLQVDSAIGAITVNNGGTLGGSGTTGAVAANAGGIVAPGASAGMLSTGAIAFAAGSTLAIEIGGAAAGTEYDQLSVTGSVNLGGATLNGSVFGGFNPGNVRTSIVIIDNDGADAVSGTFAGLAQGAAVLIGSRFFNIDYHGGDGNDVVLLSAGVRIAGTAGNDTVNGTKSPAGQPGATKFKDVIDGRGGNDKLYGLAGNDTLKGGGGNDKLYGGTQNDRLDGNGGKDQLYGGKSNDKLYGGGSADRLYGDQGSDRIYGDGGSDRIYGGKGNDKIYGGGGKDFAYFTGNSSTYNIVTKGNKTTVKGKDGTDILFNVEVLVFADGNVLV